MIDFYDIINERNIHSVYLFAVRDCVRNWPQKYENIWLIKSYNLSFFLIASGIAALFTKIAVVL